MFSDRTVFIFNTLFFFTNISFQARSWSSVVNEIEGVITDSKGRVVHSLFGKWHESVFQGDPPSATCIWRASELKVPGGGFSFIISSSVWSCMCTSADPMPVNQEQYYGFTQFAVELNELDSNLKPLLPSTDTRFRPDQRFPCLILHLCFLSTGLKAARSNHLVLNFFFLSFFFFHKCNFVGQVLFCPCGVKSKLWTLPWQQEKESTRIRLFSIN